MIRAVVDTGIIVRALIKPQGTVGPVLRWLRDGRYKLLYSDPLLDELVDVLNRPRIRDKYELSADDIQTTVASIPVRGELVVPSRRITICHDPDDNRVLEVAAEGPVDVIVSGDEHLLVLGKVGRWPGCSAGHLPSYRRGRAPSLHSPRAKLIREAMAALRSAVAANRSRRAR